MSEPSPAQLEVLRYLAGNPYGRATALCFNQRCGNARTVRALFSKGLVSGDSIPAAYVTITDAGRKALGEPVLRRGQAGGSQ